MRGKNWTMSWKLVDSWGPWVGEEKSGHQSHDYRTHSTGFANSTLLLHQSEFFINIEKLISQIAKLKQCRFLRVNIIIVEGKHYNFCEGGVRSAPQNPYPIYYQNLRFSLLYLWPDQTFDSLFKTVVNYTVALNMVFKGLLFIILSIITKKVASSKQHTQFKTSKENIPYLGLKWRKSILYLWPKRLKTHSLWGRTYLYCPYKRVPPSPAKIIARFF